MGHCYLSLSGGSPAHAVKRVAIATAAAAQVWRSWEGKTSLPLLCPTPGTKKAFKASALSALCCTRDENACLARQLI